MGRMLTSPTEVTPVARKPRKSEKPVVNPEDEPERSKSGAPIIRHEQRFRDPEPSHGDAPHIAALGRHIAKHMGPIENVFHEIASDLVHVDVHVVPPAKKRPFTTLVTTGMSERPMTVPAEAGRHAARRAELLIALPPDWPLDVESFEDERRYWPIRWLKVLARLPHEYETWLDWGHTVPNGDPPQPFAPGTKFCCNLILAPVLFPESARVAKVKGLGSVHFFAVFPLYREEMQLKLDEGTEVLLERFEEHGVTELVDVGRPNVALRRKRRR